MSKMNTGRKLVKPYFYGEIRLVDNEDEDIDLESLQNLGLSPEDAGVKTVASMALLPLEGAILTPAVDSEGHRCVKINYGDGYSMAVYTSLETIINECYE